MSRRTWWRIGIAGALCLIALAAGGVLVWRHLHSPRPSVAAVVPDLDATIAGVVADAGDSAAATVSGLVPTTSCAGGSLFAVTADLFPQAGAEDALITRIAAALPAADRPRRTAALGGGAPSLAADLGGGSTLQVIQLDAGWVAATATSGCRAPAATSGSGTAPPVADVTAALTALGTSPSTWRADTVGCVRTVSTVSGTMDLTGVRAKLLTLPPSGATVFTSPSDRIAWRVGDVSTVIAAADDGQHVTAQQTTSC